MWFLVLLLSGTYILKIVSINKWIFYIDFYNLSQKTLCVKLLTDIDTTLLLGELVKLKKNENTSKTTASNSAKVVESKSVRL